MSCGFAPQSHATNQTSHGSHSTHLSSPVTTTGTAYWLKRAGNLASQSQVQSTHPHSQVMLLNKQILQITASIHGSVFIDMNIKPKVCKQPPRKVYKYNKADGQTSRKKSQICLTNCWLKNTTWQPNSFGTRQKKAYRQSQTITYRLRSSGDIRILLGSPVK